MRRHEAFVWIVGCPQILNLSCTLRTPRQCNVQYETMAILLEWEKLLHVMQISYNHINNYLLSQLFPKRPSWRYLLFLVGCVCYILLPIISHPSEVWRLQSKLYEEPMSIHFNINVSHIEKKLNWPKYLFVHVPFCDVIVRISSPVLIVTEITKFFPKN